MAKLKENIWIILTIFILFLLGESIYEYVAEDKISLFNFAIISFILPGIFKKFCSKEKFKSYERIALAVGISLLVLELFFIFG